MPRAARPVRLLVQALASWLCSFVALPGNGLAAPARPAPGIERVLIVAVDGLRGDVLLRADAPAIRRLLARGSFTMWARTTDVAVTLPSHVSMLTGVPPSKHRVDWNNDRPDRGYPAWPTLFELARKAGYTTAMVAGKSKFLTLDKPGTLSWSFVPSGPVSEDGVVADTAVAWIGRFRPQVLFVHLPSVDTAGHTLGWGSQGQLAAIHVADGCIGRVLGALREQDLLDSTLVVVTSDHGGAGKSHGPDDPRSRFIPWIAAGPGVCEGVDLTMHAGVSVDTEDTFATVAHALGIKPSRPIDGSPVIEIFCGSRDRVDFPQVKTP